MPRFGGVSCTPTSAAFRCTGFARKRSPRFKPEETTQGTTGQSRCRAIRQDAKNTSQRSSSGAPGRGWDLLPSAGRGGTPKQFCFISPLCLSALCLQLLQIHQKNIDSKTRTELHSTAVASKAGSFPNLLNIPKSPCNCKSWKDTGQTKVRILWSQLCVIVMRNLVL